MLVARTILALLLLALLAGCGAAPGATAPAAPRLSPTPEPPAATAAPAPAPTGLPTTAPVATAAPTVAPTQALGGPTPAPGALPPAPFYALREPDGQIVRLDGRDETQISFEAEPLGEAAVAAQSGAIAYLVGVNPDAVRTLVLLDGSGRRELLSERISGLAISPDGERVAYRLDAPAGGLIVGQDASPSGVWASATRGPGRPSLLLADAPADGLYDDQAPAWRYTPVAFAPDGARLALFAFDADGPGIPGGELVILDQAGGAPVRGPTCCELPVWSGDGAALLNSGGGPGPDLRYGLYRSDAGSAAETPVIEQQPDGPVPLVSSPFAPADGPTLAFVELASADGFSWDYSFRPRISSVAADGAVTPLSQPVPWPAAVLWAPDARGAVIGHYGDTGKHESMLWVPAADQAPADLRSRGLPVAWATADLAAGDCAAFQPVAFQEAAARAFSAATRDVQARLAARGFDPGTPDGFFGEQTRAAVEAFQAEAQLPVIGDVDCATWQALLRSP